MSNSPLVDYTKISPNSSSRTAKISKITIHHMAGNLSVESCANVFQDTSRQASSNYGIGTDGRVGLYVDESRRAWTSSNRDNDNCAVTIEVANSAAGGEWPVSQKAYDKLIDLCVDICKRNGIKKLNFTGDRAGNLTMHKYFSNTQCPGPYLEKRFPEIAQAVNARLGVEAPAQEEKTERVADLPVLKNGSKGNTVKALQILLIGFGHSCGKYGADGSFGGATETAVRNFQAASGLAADGVAGPQTWAKLLGV